MPDGAIDLDALERTPIDRYGELEADFRTPFRTAQWAINEENDHNDERRRGERPSRRMTIQDAVRNHRNPDRRDYFFQGAAEIEYGRGSGMMAAAKLAFSEEITSSLMGFLAVNDSKGIPIDEDYLEEFNYIRGTEFEFREGLTDVGLEAMFSIHAKRLMYMKRIESSGIGMPLLLASGFAGAIIEPTNLLSMLIPIGAAKSVFKTASLAAQTGRMRSAIGYGLGGARQGAIINVIESVIREPFILSFQESMQTDYSLMDSAMVITLSPVLGGMLGGVGGGLRGIYKANRAALLYSAATAVADGAGDIPVTLKAAKADEADRVMGAPEFDGSLIPARRTAAEILAEEPEGVSIREVARARREANQELTDSRLDHQQELDAEPARGTPARPASADEMQFIRDMNAAHQRAIGTLANEYSGKSSKSLTDYLEALDKGNAEQIRLAREALDSAEAARLNELTVLELHRTRGELEVTEAARLIRNGRMTAATFIQNSHSPQSGSERSVATVMKAVFGVNVRFFDDAFSRASGYEGSTSYRYKKTLFVLKTNESNMFRIAGHELFHSLKYSDPVLFRKLVDMMAEAEGGKVLAKALEYTRARQGIEGKPMHLQIEEAMADIVGEYIRSPLFRQNLKKTDPSLLEYILNALREVRDALQAVWTLRSLRGKDRVLDFGKDGAVSDKQLRKFYEELHTLLREVDPDKTLSDPAVKSLTVEYIDRSVQRLIDSYAKSKKAVIKEVISDTRKELKDIEVVESFDSDFVVTDRSSVREINKGKPVRMHSPAAMLFERFLMTDRYLRTAYAELIAERIHVKLQIEQITALQQASKEMTAKLKQLTEIFKGLPEEQGYYKKIMETGAGLDEELIRLHKQLRMIESRGRNAFILEQVGKDSYVIRYTVDNEVTYHESRLDVNKIAVESRTTTPDGFKSDRMLVELEQEMEKLFQENSINDLLAYARERLGKTGNKGDLFDFEADLKERIRQRAATKKGKKALDLNDYKDSNYAYGWASESNTARSIGEDGSLKEFIISKILEAEEMTDFIGNSAALRKAASEMNELETVRRGVNPEKELDSPAVVNRIRDEKLRLQRKLSALNDEYEAKLAESGGAEPNAPMIAALSKLENRIGDIKNQLDAVDALYFKNLEEYKEKAPLLAELEEILPEIDSLSADRSKLHEQALKVYRKVTGEWDSDFAGNKIFELEDLLLIRENPHVIALEQWDAANGNRLRELREARDYIKSAVYQAENQNKINTVPFDVLEHDRIASDWGMDDLIDFSQRSVPDDKPMHMKLWDFVKGSIREKQLGLENEFKKLNSRFEQVQEQGKYNPATLRAAEADDIFQPGVIFAVYNKLNQAVAKFGAASPKTAGVQFIGSGDAPIPKKIQYRLTEIINDLNSTLIRSMYERPWRQEVKDPNAQIAAKLEAEGQLRADQEVQIFVESKPEFSAEMKPIAQAAYDKAYQEITRMLHDVSTRERIKIKIKSYGVDWLRSFMDGRYRKGIDRTNLPQGVEQIVASKRIEDLAPLLAALGKHGLYQDFINLDSPMGRTVAMAIDSETFYAKAPEQVKEIVDVLRKINIIQGGELRSMGVDIVNSARYLFSQSHNQGPMSKVAKGKWLEDTIGVTDIEATARNIRNLMISGELDSKSAVARAFIETQAAGIDIPDKDIVNVFLDNLYDDVIAGRYREDSAATAAEMHETITNPLTHSRTLVFLDGGQYNYDLKYGSGNPMGTVIEQIMRRSEVIALAHTFGTNPANNIRSILHEAGVVEGDANFRHLTEQLDIYSGQMYRSVNKKIAAAGQMARTVAALAFLGRAVFSAIGDIPASIAGLQHMTGMGFGEATYTYARAMKNAFARHMDSPESQVRWITAGAWMDAVTNSAAQRFTGELPAQSTLKKLSGTMFHMNLVNLWTGIGQEASVDMLSQAFARGVSTGDKYVNLAHLMKRHGLADMDALSKYIETDEKGVSRLMAATIDDPLISRKVNAAFDEYIRTMVIRPDVGNINRYRLGLRAGTYAGEIAPTMTQFLPIAEGVWTRVINRFINGYGEQGVAQMFTNPESRAMIHMLSFLATSAGVGFMGMMLKDISVLKEPWYFLNTEPQHIRRWLYQTQLFGPLSDLFFAKSGGDIASMAMGPFLGQAANVGSSMLNMDMGSTIKDVSQFMPFGTYPPVFVAKREFLSLLLSDGISVSQEVSLRALGR